MFASMFGAILTGLMTASAIADYATSSKDTARSQAKQELLSKNADVSSVASEIPGSEYQVKSNYEYDKGFKNKNAALVHDEVIDY